MKKRVEPVISSDQCDEIALQTRKRMQSERVRIPLLLIGRSPLVVDRLSWLYATFGLRVTRDTVQTPTLKKVGRLTIIGY